MVTRLGILKVLLDLVIYYCKSQLESLPSVAQNRVGRVSYLISFILTRMNENKARWMVASFSLKSVLCDDNKARQIY